MRSILCRYDPLFFAFPKRHLQLPIARIPSFLDYLARTLATQGRRYDSAKMQYKLVTIIAAVIMCASAAPAPPPPPSMSGMPAAPAAPKDDPMVSVSAIGSCAVRCISPTHLISNFEILTIQTARLLERERRIRRLRPQCGRQLPVRSLLRRSYLVCLANM